MSQKKTEPKLTDNLFRFGSDAEVELAVQRAILLTPEEIATALGARIVGKVNKKTLPMTGILGVRPQVKPIHTKRKQ